MKIDIGDLLSESFPIASFQSAEKVIGQQSWKTRHSLVRLNQRFKKSSIGQKVYKALRANQPNQIVAEMLLENPPTLKELFDNHMLSNDHSVSSLGKKRMSRLILYIDNRRKEIKLKVLDESGRFVTDVYPHNRKYRPERVSFDIYGIFLINLFREIAREYTVIDSVPASFKRISQENSIQLYSAPRKRL